MAEGSRGGLSERQGRLLRALQEVEAAGDPLDLEAVASATGYSVSSIRTYFTKRLEGVLVMRDEAGRWWVRGAITCSEEAFLRRMSQKAGSAAEAVKTEEGWRELVRKLLYEGSRRDYTLSADELHLVEKVRPATAASAPEPPAAADESEVTTESLQPSLFGPRR